MIRLPISEAPRDGREILTKLYGSFIIVWWHEANECGNPWPDTVTYSPGWIDGTRDCSGSRNHDGRFNVFEPEFFYHLPEEE